MAGSHLFAHFLLCLRATLTSPHQPLKLWWIFLFPQLERGLQQWVPHQPIVQTSRRARKFLPTSDCGVWDFESQASLSQVATHSQMSLAPQSTLWDQAEDTSWRTLPAPCPCLVSSLPLSSTPTPLRCPHFLSVLPGGTSLIHHSHINLHLRVCFWETWPETWPQTCICHLQLGFHKCYVITEIGKGPGAEVCSPLLLCLPFFSLLQEFTSNSPLTSLLHIQHLWAVSTIWAPHWMHLRSGLHGTLKWPLELKHAGTLSYLPSLLLAGLVAETEILPGKVLQGQCYHEVLLLQRRVANRNRRQILTRNAFRMHAVKK